MELKFNKEGEKFAAEFKVESDFNLHIERKRGGTILFYQRTSEDGDYGIIDGMRQYDSRGVIDVDFTALVYPKYIRIVSESEPTLAVVTFNA